MEYPRGTDSARIITVIETKAARGSGKNENSPARIVTQYWSLNGKLLAERDSWGEEAQNETKHG